MRKVKKTLVNFLFLLNNDRVMYGFLDLQKRDKTVIKPLNMLSQIKLLFYLKINLFDIYIYIKFINLF